MNGASFCEDDDGVARTFSASTFSTCAAPWSLKVIFFDMMSNEATSQTAQGVKSTRNRCVGRDAPKPGEDQLYMHCTFPMLQRDILQRSIPLTYRHLHSRANATLQDLYLGRQQQAREMRHQWWSMWALNADKRHEVVVP